MESPVFEADLLYDGRIAGYGWSATVFIKEKDGRQYIGSTEGAYCTRVEIMLAAKEIAYRYIVPTTVAFRLYE